MNSVRLLPIVMVAASALLLFKLFGLVSGDLYILGNRAALAQETENALADEVGAGEVEMEPEPVEEMAEGDDAVMGATDAALNPNRPKDGEPITINKEGRIEKLSERTGVSNTELEFLERLSERRKQLDIREEQLAVQEAIIRAAELRLETRAKELQEIESRISALVEQKEGQEADQFKSLVATYESMKPKDSARIFNRLDMRVLVRMVQMMNPRKFAPVMAAMEAEKAEALTLNLANPNLSEFSQTSVGNAGEQLPQIVGQ
ncbi:MotE family protein [Maritalea sp.]|uniref:MotE family protein n=1 Tax=Maritalea sp. TaxID=2003361 RepID=UPI003EF7C568